MTTLTLDLSEDKIRNLKKRADKSGKSLEDYIRELIERFDSPDFDVTEDPIYKIKGRDTKAPSDLASKHDKYLYE